MYEFLAIGFSAGGLPLVGKILAALPTDYPLAVAIVCHLPRGQDSALAEVLAHSSRLPVVTARDKMAIQHGRVHVAPPDYHLLVENRRQFALSVDPPVSAVRPSIDLLFDSAAEAFQSDMIALTLSGANSDGVHGMARAHAWGAMTICLSPLHAKFSTLPEAVVKSVDVDYIADLDDIMALLCAAAERR